MADRRIGRRRVAAGLAAVVAILVAIVLVTSGGDDGPPRVSGTPAEAVTVVDEFQAALTTRDFQTVCDRLFSARARHAAGGDNCRSVLAQAAATLPVPRMRITSLSVARGGRGAVVNVLASTGGRRATPDTIRLVRERGRFRIDSAGEVAG